MKIFNHQYKNTNSLEIFIKENNIPDNSRVLLQVFTGIAEKKHFSNVVNSVCKLLPNINIIGASSFSEIADGKVLKLSTILSFTVFEKTDVRTAYISDPSFESGLNTVSRLLTDRSKCMIVLSTALQTDCIPFLNGIQSIAPHITLAGGYAADDYKFEDTFVAENSKVYNKGISIAVLDSDELIIYHDYSLNWNPFGKEFTITKTEGNVVKELNNEPIINVVKHYFGKEAVSNLPASLIEFPLIKNVEETLVARSTVAVSDDGFLYAGDFNEGDKVRFGVGDLENMHNNALKLSHKLSNKPIEGIFIYSCTGRYTFLGNAMDIEIEMLNKVANTAGFFTLGEIYHTGSTNQVLNLTTTFITLSESSKLPEINHKDKPSLKPQSQMLSYLTNFINTMAMELEENVKFLQNYKEILDATTIVSKTDPKGIITYVNEAFCALTEYSEDDVLGHSHGMVKHPETPIEVHQNMWNTIKAKKTWKGIVRNISKSGKTLYLDTVILPIINKEGDITEYMSIRHDMTKIIRQEQLINEQLTDNLTKLPNRVKLFNDMENNHIDSLALFNIDGFKGINDLYGFDIADQLLVHIADFLRFRLTYDMNLYRIGGDVFVITASGGIAEIFKEKMINLITDLNKTVFKCGDYDVDVSLTGGLAYDTDRLLTSAEVAFRNAKKDGLILDVITRKSPEANTYLENTRWLRTVKDAIHSGNIINYYQKIESLRNPEDYKYEALVRLRDSEGKIHSPFAFLPVVKQTSEYEQLTKTVIANTYEACKKYNYNFTINLSAQDIKNKSTVNYLKHMFSAKETAERITLEITESEAIVDYNHVNAFINDFKEMGCKIAIDDFGSGYSNFAYLAQFNVDYLKIDGSIIKRVTEDKNALITLESILDFAKRLGVKTIAEFVSDEVIYNNMKDLRVDYVQGYYIDKPKPLK